MGDYDGEVGGGRDGSGREAEGVGVGNSVGSAVRGLVVEVEGASVRALSRGGVGSKLAMGSSTGGSLVSLSPRVSLVECQSDSLSQPTPL